MRSMKLEQLHLRAFGGGDVAADPIADSGEGWWPEVQPAPGAREAVELFLKDIQTQSGPLAWLVLLGGPGNGKSALLRDLVATHASGPDSALRQADPILSKEIHHRSYDFVTAFQDRVRLVNDATIKTDGATVGSDFSYALNEQAHLLMNVNRGVLVEDLRQAQERGDPLEAALVKLLIRARSDMGWDSPHSELEGVKLEKIGEDVPYLMQARLSLDGRSVILRVVSLDVCSLLEPRPDTEMSMSGGDNLLKGNPYVMASFANLEERLETPAGDLFKEVAETLERLETPSDGAGNWDVEWNPLAANVKSLSSPEVRAGLLRVLRAAEIMEGRLFTFRELWNTVALLYVGSTSSDPISLDYVGEQIKGFEKVAGSPGKLEKRLGYLLSLSRFRFTQALFAEPPVSIRGERQSAAAATPVTERLRRSDPVLDTRLGSSTDLTDGWATPVLEALEAARFNGEVLSRLEQESPAFSAMVASFDRLVESTLLEWWHSKAEDKQVAETMRWFGGYVLRLYAFAHGIPAFGADILAWTEFWRKRSHGHDDDAMDRRIRRLIVPMLAPRGDEPGKVVLPVFDARVEPLRSLTDDPQLVARFSPDDLQIRSSPHAERMLLQVRVKHGGEYKPLVSLLFDYPLLREAMAHSSAGQGATELGAQCTPRLERARASFLLGSGPAKRWAIVDSHGVKSLHVSDRK